MTAPNRLIPDRNESVCITLHNLDSSQDIDITVTLSTYVSYQRWGTPKADNKTLQVVKTTLQPAYGGKSTYTTSMTQFYTSTCGGKSITPIHQGVFVNRYKNLPLLLLYVVNHLN